MGFPSIRDLMEKEKNRRYEHMGEISSTSYYRTHRGVRRGSTTWICITLICVHIKKTLHVKMLYEDYTTLVCRILLRTPWRSEVKAFRDVPVSFFQGIAAAHMEIHWVFPEISNEEIEAQAFPPFLRRVLCVERYIIAKEALEAQAALWRESMEATELPQTNEDAACLPSDETQSTSTEDSMSDVFDDTDADHVLLAPETRTEFKRIKHEGCRSPLMQEDAASFSPYHPYVISAVVFAVAVCLSEQLQPVENNPTSAAATQTWSARRVYLFLHDFLRDQVKLTNIPRALRSAGILLLYWFTGKEMKEISVDGILKKYVQQLTSFFGDVSLIFALHKCPVRENTPTLRRTGSLYPCTQISRADFTQMMPQDFYMPHEPTPGRGCAVVHLPEALRSENCLFVQFAREQVSPLALYSSMRILERRFALAENHDSEEHKRKEWMLWKPLFTKTLTLLLVDKTLWREIVQTCIPALISFSSAVFSRNVSFPTYQLHLHNYFHGSNGGLLASMKFLLRCFSSSGQPRAECGGMPRAHGDENIAFYGILHEIADRFSSKEWIWYELTRPYRTNEALWRASNSKGRWETRGFNGDYPTLYTALYAFIHIYRTHYIEKQAVYRLVYAFSDESNALPTKYPAVWAVIRLLCDCAEKNQRDPHEIWIRMPDTFEFQGVTLRPHLVLYLFCCAPEIDDLTAGVIFLSMRVYLRKTDTAGRKIGRMRLTDHARRQSSRLKFHYLMEQDADAHRQRIAKEATTGRVPERYEGIAFIFRVLEELAYRPFASCCSRCADESEVPLPKKRKKHGPMPVGRDKHRTPEEICRCQSAVPEAYISLSSEEILYDAKAFPRLPLDRITSSPSEKEQTIYSESCFPVWKAEIHDAGHQRDMHEHHKRDCSIVMDYAEAKPLVGCHDELLDCVLLYPITVVQILSDGDCQHDLSKMKISTSETDNAEPLFTIPYPWMKMTEADVNHCCPYDLRGCRSPMHESMERIADDREGWRGTLPYFSSIFRESLK